MSMWTREELRAKWRADAQALRDRRKAEGLNSQGQLPKRYLTPGGIERIREAQRARWAKDEGKKRVLTPKQIKAMRNNAKLARAAFAAKHKTKQPMSIERRMEISKVMRAAYAKKHAAKAAEQGEQQQ